MRGRRSAEELRDELHRAKQELAAYQLANRLSAEAVELNVAAWLDTARGIERRAVDALLSAIAQGHGAFTTEAIDALRRQGELEDADFASFVRRGAMGQFGQLSTQTEIEAETARLEANVRSLELALEDLDLKAGEDELRQRRRSLRERLGGAST